MLIGVYKYFENLKIIKNIVNVFMFLYTKILIIFFYT